MHDTFVFKSYPEDEDDLTICLEVPRKFGARCYEMLLDDYMYFTPREFANLEAAMEKFRKKERKNGKGKA